MIKTKNKKSYIEVDLTGPQGNAYYLLGLAANLAKQVGYDSDELRKEMMAGDYDNLVEVFDKHFGSFVVLYK